MQFVLYLGSSEVKSAHWAGDNGWLHILCRSQSKSQSSAMKAFIFSSALLAIAAANTCDDCTAVVNVLGMGLVSDESIADQQVCASLVWGRPPPKI